MRRMFFLMSFGISAAMLGVTQSHAPGVLCAEYAVISDRLADRFGEYRHASFLRDNAVVAIFASPATGSWTMTLTRPDELTCLIAAGQAFDPLSLPLDMSITDRSA